MQERTVTVAGVTHALPDPFLVLATQNPIEMEGTYPLPEAQRDRFLYQVNVSFPAIHDLVEIARREATPLPDMLPTTHVPALHDMRAACQHILVSDVMLRYIASIVHATHAQHSPVAAVREMVRYGASPRAVQAIVRTAQVEALCAGRLHVDITDVHQVMYPALRHRLVLKREASIARVYADDLIQQIIAEVPVP